MKIELKVSFHLRSDFHLGTGSGRGRTIDAQILKDAQGCPYILGSTIKGLARAQAEHVVCKAVTQFTPEHVNCVFGARGGEGGAFYFGDAVPESNTYDRPHVVGRSARDRTTGTTLKKSLVHNEVAAGATFMCTVDSKDVDATSMTWQSLALLILSLRRIEAIGASRRRGLGKCFVEVSVAAWPHGIPVANANNYVHFNEKTATKWLSKLIDGSPPQEFKTSNKTLEIPLSDETTSCLIMLGEAVGPLVLGANQGAENVIQSLDYIPGSSWRGAIAWHLIRQGLSADGDQFQNLFVKEQLQFGPLYPLDRFWSKPQTLPFRLPFSFVECKDQPGERRKNVFQSGHGISDRLRAKQPEDCHCGEPLTGCSSWATLFRPTTNSANHMVACSSVSMQTILRSEIDSAFTQRAKPGQLFATEAIPAGTCFAGYLWGPKSAIDWVRDELLNRPLELNIGKSQTRGHGRLRIWSEKNASNSVERNAIYPGMYVANNPDGSPPPDRFTVYVYSDLIAVDSLLRPLTVLNEQSLRSLLGWNGDLPIKKVRSFVQLTRIIGFNGVAKLPRTPDLAIKAGSTACFQWTDEDQNRRGELWNKLLELSKNGTGLRCGEGFGRLMIDPPIHQAQLCQNSDDSSIEFSVDCGSDHNPNSSESPVFRNFSPEFQTSGKQTAANKLAEKCPTKIRQSVARLLWQLATKADDSQAVEQTLNAFASELNNFASTVPKPLGKQSSTRDQVAEYLKEVIAELPIKNRGLFIRYLAEQLIVINRKD